MTPLEGLTAFLAKKLATKVIDASIGAVKRRLVNSDVERAFTDAIADAFEEVLPKFVPDSFADDEIVQQHLRDLVGVPHLTQVRQGVFQPSAVELGLGSSSF